MDLPLVQEDTALTVNLTLFKHLQVDHVREDRLAGSQKRVIRYAQSSHRRRLHLPVSLGL